MTSERRREAGQQWSGAALAKFKPLLFLICLYPVFRWLWLAYLGEGGLTANPPEFLIRSTGLWSLILLWLTLCITPIRRLLKQPALIRFRRMLGLFSFFYAFLHVLGWAWWEQGGSFADMWADILQRTFVWVGVIAFFPMLLMALTSTKGWVRRLGHGWQRLHSSVYLVAALSVCHFWLVRSGKVDFLEPMVYGVILFFILAIRYLVRSRRT